MAFFWGDEVQGKCMEEVSLNPKLGLHPKSSEIRIFGITSLSPQNVEASTMQKITFLYWRTSCNMVSKIPRQKYPGKDWWLIHLFFLAKKSHEAIDFLHVSIPQFLGFNLVARLVVGWWQKCWLVTWSFEEAHGMFAFATDQRSWVGSGIAAAGCLPLEWIVVETNWDFLNVG